MQVIRSKMKCKPELEMWMNRWMHCVWTDNTPEQETYSEKMAGRENWYKKAIEEIERERAREWKSVKIVDDSDDGATHTQNEHTKNVYKT